MEKSASSAPGQSLSEDDIRNIQHERVLPQRKGFKIEIIKCRILFRFVIGRWESSSFTWAGDNWGWFQSAVNPGYWLELSSAHVSRSGGTKRLRGGQICLKVWTPILPLSFMTLLLTAFQRHLYPLKTAAKVIGAVRLQGSSKPEEGRRPLQVVCTSTEGPQRATVALIIISFASWKRREGRGQTRMLYLLLIYLGSVQSQELRIQASSPRPQNQGFICSPSFILRYVSVCLGRSARS